MENLNPIDIVEIRLLIGSSLNVHQLLTCSLVCRSWRDTFLPLLYQSFTFTPNTKTPPETLNKYSEHIRFLVCLGYIPTQLESFRCSKLVSLIIERPSMTPFPETIPSSGISIPELILLNKDTLKYFSLKEIWQASTPSLWEALYQCSSLQAISIHHIVIYNDSLIPFLKIYQRLSKLVLYNTIFVGVEPKSNPPMQLEFPNLTTISLHSSHLGGGCSFPFLLQMIQTAPLLRSLHWKTTSLFEIEEGYFQSIMSSTKFNNFEELNISAGKLDDQSTATILDAMYRAKSFEVVMSEFGAKSYQSLISRHANTIRHIGLHSCSGLSSEIVQGILTQCPLLEVFKGHRISGAELVKVRRVGSSNLDPDGLTVGKDWVCLQLRWLILSFDLSGKDAGIDERTAEGKELMELQKSLEQKHAFRQLSRMTELRWLAFSHPGCEVDQTLKLKLGSRGGELEQLKRLKKLERVDLGRKPQDISEKEIDWIGSHWPRIKILNGTLNANNKVNAGLETYANIAYGISVNLRN